MPTLSQLLGIRVPEWRKAGYPSDIPEIAELLRYQKDDDGRLRFLRKAQLEALEVYFYLRAVLNTSRRKTVSACRQSGNHCMRVCPGAPIRPQERLRLQPPKRSGAISMA